MTNVQVLKFGAYAFSKVLAIILWCNTFVVGQICYQPIDNASKYQLNLDGNLELDACALNAEMPPGTNFTTFSASGYYLNSYKSGSDIDDIGLEIASQLAAQDGYLLFYWEPSKEETYYQGSLFAKLPTLGYLSCVSQIRKTAAVNSLTRLFAELSSQSRVDISAQEVERLVIAEATGIVSDWQDCCSSTDGACSKALLPNEILLTIPPIQHEVLYSNDAANVQVTNGYKIVNTSNAIIYELDSISFPVNRSPVWSTPPPYSVTANA